MFYSIELTTLIGLLGATTLFLGVGLDGLKNTKNAIADGIIDNSHEVNITDNLCQYQISWRPSGRTEDICDHVNSSCNPNTTGNRIHVCYNKWNPDNFAVANNFTNGTDFCLDSTIRIDYMLIGIGTYTGVMSLILMVILMEFRAWDP